MNKSKNKFNPLVWLEALSWPRLTGIALIFGIVPIVPEPHLVEKLRMLFHGTLTRPIDIFDLFLHSSPLLLMGLKAFLQYRRRQKKTAH